MDMELTVEQKLVLYVNGKHCIPEQQYVDGETFMHLKKWDRALVKTMTGKILRPQARQIQWFLEH